MSPTVDDDGRPVCGVGKDMSCDKEQQTTAGDNWQAVPDRPGWWWLYCEDPYEPFFEPVQIFMEQRGAGPLRGWYRTFDGLHELHTGDGRTTHWLFIPRPALPPPSPPGVG